MRFIFFTLLILTSCNSVEHVSANWSYREGLRDEPDLSQLKEEEVTFYNSIKGKYSKREIGDWLLHDTYEARQEARKKFH